MIVTYSPKEIPFIWADVEHYIQKALDRGSFYRLEDIYSHLRSSTMQLWVYRNPKIKAVATTAISGTNCYIVTLGGEDMREWIHTFYTIEKWALDEGCESMTIQGRKGWARVLGFDIEGKDELGLYILKRDYTCQTQAVQNKPKTPTPASLETTGTTAR